MARKISIHLSDDMEAAINERLEDGDGRSTWLGTAVRRYLELCRRELPKLTTAEWSLVFDALNGYALMADDARHVHWSVITIADGMKQNGLARKWKVDGETLTAAMDAWTFGQRCAVIDAAERFWARDGANVQDIVTATDAAEN